MVNPQRALTSIYEIHTAVYLERLSRLHGSRITLASIPDEELSRIASYGCDAVWLMGIWQRSPLAVEIGLQDASLMRQINDILPDATEHDLIGSAYAIGAYQIDALFGDDNELALLRERLRAHGMKLLLDFVPNHTAFDHAWISTHSEYYVKGTPDELTRHPDWYRQCGEVVVAHGKDPHFEPWPDVAQLNAFSEAYRQASIDTLNNIASRCDGVRCDMAMLMTNSVFSQTWPDSSPEIPPAEYWTSVISSVRSTHEYFTFIAECYWDMQAELIDQGFDYCYDKDLYDFLIVGDETAAHDHIENVSAIADHLVHFLENHDEPRIASKLDIQKHETALQLINAQPGAKLWNDGEFDGYRIKLPVHIRRGPIEPRDDAIYELYRTRLMS